MSARPELASRFWAKVDVLGEDECWLWLGASYVTGYGIFTVNNRPRMATHISLELDGRPRPENLFALHSCDNPRCVNPRHLRWGTVKENAADMVARGRAVPRDQHWTNLRPDQIARADRHGARTKPDRVRRGVNVNTAKLTEADIPLIRADRRPLRDIAEEYGVSISMISRIRRREAWTHV